MNSITMVISASAVNHALDQYCQLNMSVKADGGGKKRP
jgi:hypothetical protein